MVQSREGVDIMDFGYYSPVSEYVNARMRRHRCTLCNDGVFRNNRCTYHYIYSMDGADDLGVLGLLLEWLGL